MTTLRGAAEQALEALERGETKLRYAAITALKAALAEPDSVQEDADRYRWLQNSPKGVYVASLFPSEWDAAIDAERAEPVQEPVAWKDKTFGNLHHRDFGNSIPLYTTPPQRPFVGLTADERQGIREWKAIQQELGPVWAPMMLYLYEAIEAALREKNT